MSKELSFAKDLISFIDKSPCSFYAIKEIKERLLKDGFKELNEAEKWKIKSGKKYFVTKNDAAIVAFKMGTEAVAEAGFRIISSHADSPGYKIKPSPEIKVEGKYLSLNTDVYGGPILASWFDRALSVAGRVAIKSDNVIKPRMELVNIDKDLCVIPSLCIHMNREVNEGVKIDPQKDTLPLIATIDKDFNEDGYLIKLIAKELNVDPEEILDIELFLYDREKGKIIGANDEFIHSGRMDNLGMAHVSLMSLIDAGESKATDVIAIYDNEEIGSKTAQGANSPFLKNTLRRISIASGAEGEEDFLRALASSFLFSADEGHPLHPNYGEMHDPTNRAVINGGPLAKYSAVQSYISDAYGGGLFAGLCKKANVPMQTTINRSGARGGTTIGPIVSTQLDIPSLDVGNPVLAMHSVRELGGVYDHYYMKLVFDEFFK